jgi:hypothetical protein
MINLILTFLHPSYNDIIILLLDISGQNQE